LGSFLFGWLSFKFGSRKKTILLANTMIAVLTIIYFSIFRASPGIFYSIIFLLGIPMGGLWAVFITTTSEQFGTNMRSTVTTSAPNFVRGSTIIITFLLGIFTSMTGLWSAGVIVGIICIGIALAASFFIEETYGKELDYLENI